MASRYFPAIIDTGPSGFGVTFPDLPGCTSAGDSIDDATRSAEEALALHLRGMMEDGEDIPNPTPLDKIKPDLEVDEVARVLIRAELPCKMAQFNATMDDALLSRVDRAAQHLGMTRSGFLSEAARRMLAGVEL